MLGEQGHIVLTDFGSAKMLEVSEKTSTIAGTPQYIAPEVLRGELYSFSADWWSCGILLYEMLTGKVGCNSGTKAGPVYRFQSGLKLIPGHNLVQIESVYTYSIRIPAWIQTYVFTRLNSL